MSTSTPNTRARDSLAAAGLGLGPRTAPPASPLSFEDGRAYRVEIASVESPEAFEAIVEEGDRLGVRVDRISQGSGIMLLADDQIRHMLALGAARDVEVCLFVGPRASWDVGVQATSLA